MCRQVERFFEFYQPVVSFNLCRWSVLDITIDIDSLAHDGRGLGRMTTGADSGKVIFVAGALPGQKVRARILRSRSGFLDAVCERVMVPAPNELSPHCPHSASCGGCPLQTMPYHGPNSQLYWKGRLASEAMRRIGKIVGDGQEEILSDLARPLPSPLLAAFRNKMEFAFGSDEAGNGSGLVLGQRQRGGHGVCQVPGCVLLPAGWQEIVNAAQEFAGQSGLDAYRPGAGAEARRRQRGRKVPGPAGMGMSGRGFWRFLTVRCGWPVSQEGGIVSETDGMLPKMAWWLVCLTSPGNRQERAMVRQMAEKLMASFPSLAAFVHEERSHDDGLALGQRRVFCIGRNGQEQASRLALPLAGRWFGLDAASFFQVNCKAADLLASQVVEMLGTGKKLLDCYCGVGAPGQLSARAFGQIIGIESDKRATRLAKNNAQAAGLDNCRYLTGVVGKMAGKPESMPAVFDIQGGTVLLDPPRAGLDSDLLGWLVKARAKRLVYVSCNHATLARDAVYLAQEYRLSRCTGVDLFPHTPHLEICSLWEKK